jgi:hypothetical protein
MPRERVAEILINSDTVAVGKITDDFEKNVKSFFQDSALTRSTICSLLEKDEKLKIPLKIREMIVSSILSHFQSLSGKELVRIPSLIRRLPSTIISSETEDKLIEQLLEVFRSGLLNRLSKEDISKLIIDAKKLHVRHRCKDEFFVRFLSNLSCDSQRTTSLLRILGENVPIRKLAHPVVRHSMIQLLRSVNTQVPMGDLLHAVSRLPIFPEGGEILAELSSRNLLKSDSVQDAVIGCLGVLRMKLPDSFSLSEMVKKSSQNPQGVESLLEGICRVSDGPLNHSVVDLLVRAISIEKVAGKNPFVIAGYMRLLSLVSPSRLSDEMKMLTDKLPVKMELDASIEILRHVTQQREFFVRHIEPCIGELTHVHARKILKSEDWIVNRIVEKSSDPVVLATILSGSGNSASAEKLVKILPTNDTASLVKLWRVVTEFGTRFPESNSPEKRLLKELTKNIFRSVRMAPVS